MFSPMFEFLKVGIVQEGLERQLQNNYNSRTPAKSKKEHDNVSEKRNLEMQRLIAESEVSKHLLRNL